MFHSFWCERPPESIKIATKVSAGVTPDLLKSRGNRCCGASGQRVNHLKLSAEKNSPDPTPIRRSLEQRTRVAFIAP